MTILKSIGAGLAAIVATIVLSLLADLCVYTAWGVAPFSRPLTDQLFGLAVAYRSVFGILGGWIVARLAPRSPMRHALVVGALGLLVGVVGVVASWDKPELGPRWYAIAVAVIALPTAWMGGRLHRAR